MLENNNLAIILFLLLLISIISLACFTIFFIISLGDKTRYLEKKLSIIFGIITLVISFPLFLLIRYKISTENDSQISYINKNVSVYEQHFI